MAITKQANSNANVKQLTDSDVGGNFVPINKFSALYDAYVGTAVRVQEGVATHSSLATAIASLPNGGAIYLLNGTVTENVTLSINGIRIVGKGNISILNGNFTVSGSKNDLDSIRVSGNLSVSGNNNFLKVWISSTSTFSNTGIANDYRVTQE